MKTIYIFELIGWKYPFENHSTKKDPRLPADSVGIQNFSSYHGDNIFCKFDEAVIIILSIAIWGIAVLRVVDKRWGLKLELIRLIYRQVA